MKHFTIKGDHWIIIDTGNTKFNLTILPDGKIRIQKTGQTLSEGIKIMPEVSNVIIIE